jgi:hypothetical protein
MQAFALQAALVPYHEFDKSFDHEAIVFVDPNAYIERIEKHSAKWGKESAVERGRRMICSWTLGREFGETCDAFFARNPDMAEFQAWFKGFDND